MRHAIRLGAISALALAAGLTSAATIDNSELGAWRPTGKGTAVFDKSYAAKVTPSARGSQIIYHNGPVMTNAAGVNVYVIWYGNWAGNTGTTLVPDFFTHLGGSPYWNINTTYYDGSGAFIKNAVTLAGQTTDAYSQGTTLTDAKVFTVVTAAIAGGRLPKDANGVYFVLTSADVNESSGFCTQYCGWHTHGSYSATDIKYSFVGDASRCIASCAAQSVGPNGNPGVDGMLSVVAHELEETVSDPDLNAWFFSSGNENGDQCAWKFGTTYTSGGANANVHLGSRDYLLQQNWIRATAGKCALAY